MTIKAGALVAAIFMAPLIVASVTVCAPKWFRARFPKDGDILASGEPERWWQRDPEEILKTDMGGPSLRPFWVVLLAPVVFVLWLVMTWVSALVSLVVLKCPYTSEQDRQRSEMVGLWEDLRDVPGMARDLLGDARDWIRDGRST